MITHGTTSDGHRYLISQGIFCEICRRDITSTFEGDYPLCDGCLEDNLAAILTLQAALASVGTESQDWLARRTLRRAILSLADPRANEDRVIAVIVQELQQSATIRSIRQQRDAGASRLFV